MCKDFRDCFTCGKNDCYRSIPLRNEKTEKQIADKAKRKEKSLQRKELKEAMQKVGVINESP